MNETLKHAIDIFSFVIIGQGEMSGEEFGKRIRKAFDCEENLKNKSCVEEIESKVVTIRSDYGGKVCGTFKK